MKKVVVVLMIILLMNCGCEKDINKDAIKFKNEYESLNNKVNSNNKKYIDVSIDEENGMIYASYDKVIDIIKNETAIIYFGFPECPWCRNAVPVLLDAIKEMGIDKIYYYNALAIRDKKTLDDNGNIIVEDEGTKEYKELVKLLYDHLPAYGGLNDETIKRLYFPTVLFVKNGEILGLEQSLSSYSKRVDGDPLIPMTKEEQTELANIFTEYYKQIQPK